jgi:hypothetical protein
LAGIFKRLSNQTKKTGQSFIPIFNINNRTSEFLGCIMAKRFTSGAISDFRKGDKNAGFLIFLEQLYAALIPG